MKIFGVERNYIPRNKEADMTLYKQGEPVIFTKADSSLLKNGKPFFIPDDMGEIDCEGVLAVRIDRMGKSIPERFARRYWGAATVGVDFTARRLLERLRAKGLPWDICKGFDGSSVIGTWTEQPPYEAQANGGGEEELSFLLLINGQPAVSGAVSDMLFGIPRLISYISRFFTLKTGDIIFTGAPSGALPVKENDHIEGFLNNKKVLDFYCK